MARVECDVEETLIEHGQKSVDGICITCSRCDHSVELRGRDTERNRRKAVEELHRTCPEKENNFYTFPVTEREEVRMHTTDE